MKPNSIQELFQFMMSIYSSQELFQSMRSIYGSQELFQSMVRFFSGMQPGEEVSMNTLLRTDTWKTSWADTNTHFKWINTLPYQCQNIIFFILELGNISDTLILNCMAHFWYHVYCRKSEDENTLSKLFFPASMKADTLWLKT